MNKKTTLYRSESMGLCYDGENHNYVLSLGKEKYPLENEFYETFSGSKSSLLIKMLSLKHPSISESLMESKLKMDELELAFKKK